MPKYKEAPAAATMPDDGAVEGYAATFDRIRDSYGDVIAKGAFADSLKRWQEIDKPIPLLYGHSTTDPQYNIGRVVEAREDDHGLFVRAEFDADNPKAQYVRKLVKEGRLYQFSFAYEVQDAGTVELEDGADAYELRKLDLFEVSLVQIPANQRAVVTDVKGDGDTKTKDAPAEVKSGRRNSKADADELRAARDLARQIVTIVNGLLADEDDTDDEPTGDVKPEDPSAGNGESGAKSGDALDALRDVANNLLSTDKE